MFQNTALFCCKIFEVTKWFMRHPANTRAFKRRRFLAIVGAWKGFFWRVLRKWNKQIFFILFDALCWLIAWFSVEIFMCWSWWWWYHWPAHLDIWPRIQVFDCFSSLAFYISCLFFAKETVCFQFVRHDRVHCLAVSYQGELELKVLLIKLSQCTAICL